jgi:hypothetical protein
LALQKGQWKSAPRPSRKGKETTRLRICKRSAIAQAQKERVTNGDISTATLRNYIKAIKLFCEMNDIVITWKKKITRGLPRARRFADEKRLIKLNIFFGF